MSLAAVTSFCGGLNWLVVLYTRAGDEQRYDSCSAQQAQTAQDIFFSCVVVLFLWCFNEYLQEQYSNMMKEEVFGIPTRQRADTLPPPYHDSEWDRELRGWGSRKKERQAVFVVGTRRR